MRASYSLSLLIIEQPIPSIMQPETVNGSHFATSGDYYLPTIVVPIGTVVDDEGRASLHTSGSTAELNSYATGTGSTMYSSSASLSTHRRPPMSPGQEVEH